MHLISRRPQTVRVQGREIRFAEGEAITTEYSYKYRIEDFHRLAERAGFAAARVWTDEWRMFSVHYLTTGEY
jgi:L-histidine Nalpha-methyltransferase